MNEFDSGDPVCAHCFGDPDISAFIDGVGDPPGCAFCGESDAPTAPLHLVVDHIGHCLGQYYGLAVEQLPYESREGGYLGLHWDTYELLYDQVGLSLERDTDSRLEFAIASEIGDEAWCEYDWLSLDYDDQLDYSWRHFCQLIQHRRRFFFALPDSQDEDMIMEDRDRMPPLRLLAELSAIAADAGLTAVLPEGTEVFRGRPSGPDVLYQTADELGPPPPEHSLQSNRMNPPGIPMMYTAENVDTAVREVQSPFVSVGRFRLERDIAILDLAALPTIPGFFSGADRRDRLGKLFLHEFVREITKPVERDDRVHIDYIPSQVVTEYIRDNEIDGARLQGIRYPSSLGGEGCNLVLFVTREDLMEIDGTPVSNSDFLTPTPWIRLLGARQIQSTMTEE